MRQHCRARKRRKRGNEGNAFLKSETKAQGQDAEALIFSWGRIDAIIDSNRTDRQVVPHPATNSGRKIVEWCGAGPAGVEKGCSHQISIDRNIIFNVENGPGGSADGMVFSILGAQISLVKASNGGRPAVEKSLIDRHPLGSLDRIDVTEPGPNRQKRFAETEIRRMPAGQPGKTSTAIDTFRKGGGSIKYPPLVRV